MVHVLECIGRIKEDSAPGRETVAGMRNVLVHDYFDVDFESIWNVVTRDLVPLQFVMSTILARLNDND